MPPQMITQNPSMMNFIPQQGPLKNTTFNQTNTTIQNQNINSRLNLNVALINEPSIYIDDLPEHKFAMNRMKNIQNSKAESSNIYLETSIRIDEYDEENVSN